MPRGWAIWLPAAALLLAGCVGGEAETPPAAPPVPPASLCLAEGGAVACGGARCEPLGGDRWSCPGERLCGTLPDGLGGATVLCQRQDRGGEDAPPAEEEEGGTTVRPPRPPPVEEEPLRRVSGDCSVGVVARVELKRGNRLIETQNLANGFDEIVIPGGFDAKATMRPDAAANGPYEGRLEASWRAPSARLFHGRAGRTFADLQSGWSDSERRKWPVGRRPEPHRITAVWTPEGSDPCPPLQHDFTVTFAGHVQVGPTLNLADFVARARGRAAPDGGTRVLGEEPRPVPRSTREVIPGEELIVVPIAIYWDLPADCCGIPGARRKVVQFARAAIHGPNGRLAKPWTLDIHSSQLPAAANTPPTHDPSYGFPRNDGHQPAGPGGPGGVEHRGPDRLQYDAPGMPQSLYERLFSAQGPSTYRQQFLSLMLCVPRGDDDERHTPAFYLANARVQQLLVTTIRWNFPGRRAAPQPQQAVPTITISSRGRAGGCRPLRPFLEANGLLDAFLGPTEEARRLRILPRAEYDEVVRDVVRWETDPLGQLR